MCLVLEGLSRLVTPQIWRFLKANPVPLQSKVQPESMPMRVCELPCIKFIYYNHQVIILKKTEFEGAREREVRLI